MMVDIEKEMERKAIANSMVEVRGEPLLEREEEEKVGFMERL